MKSPRRIDHASKELTNVSTDPPPQSSLFWQMWNANQANAQAALETPFVAGIGAGNLNPTTYGGFNVNDAYYCFNGAQDYLNAANRATDPTLKAFLTNKYQSYLKYNNEFPTVWRVKDEQGIVPYQAAIEYSAFEASVASQQAPIYTLIAMIPCEYLWAWLGSQLSPPNPNSLYAPWVTGNNDPSGAYKMGNYLATYMAANPNTVDTTTATNIYTQAMKYEVANFNAAGSQN